MVKYKTLDCCENLDKNKYYDYPIEYDELFTIPSMTQRINDLSLSKLEELILDYMDKYQKFITNGIYSSTVIQKEKKESFNELFNLLAIIEYLQKKWLQKFSMLSDIERQNYLSKIKNNVKR